MTPRVIWCLGMYASASTWLFNVVQQIYQAGAPGDQIQPHFFSGKGNFAKFGGGKTDIVKSHEITDDGTVLELIKRAQKIFVTMRDPRDAVTSLMLYHAYEFDRALPLVQKACALCADFAKEKRTLVYRYEDGFFDDPATVPRIAAHLGIQITAAQAAKIFSGMTRQAVETYIAGLPKLPGILQDRVSGDLLDPRTHWHSHHAGRSGEIGRWKNMLTPAQDAEMQSKLVEVYDFS